MTDNLAHALASQDFGAKLISLSTVESDVHLASAERKIGRCLEQLSSMAGAQVGFSGMMVVSRADFSVGKRKRAYQ